MRSGSGEFPAVAAGQERADPVPCPGVGGEEARERRPLRFDGGVEARRQPVQPLLRGTAEPARLGAEPPPRGRGGADPGDGVPEPTESVVPVELAAHQPGCRVRTH
ncbi:hypothetical protein ABH917_004818 [Thermobifida halotolerans]